MRRNSRYHHNSAGPIHGQERGRGVRLAPRTLTDFRLEEVLEIHAKILQMCDGTALGKLLNFINSNQPFSNLPLAAKRVKLFWENMPDDKVDRTRQIIRILVQHNQSARSYRIPEENEIRGMFAATSVKPVGIEITTIQQMIQQAKDQSRQAG